MTSQIIDLTGQTGVNLSYSPGQGKMWRLLGASVTLVTSATAGTRSVRVSVQRGTSGFGPEVCDTGSQTTVSTTFYGVGDVAADASPILANEHVVQWGGHPLITYPDVLEVTAVLISGDKYDVRLVWEVLDG